jgi:predicted NACHT family NTPase
VTSRIAGFDGHPFEAANLPIFTLDDLDEDQVRTFAENCFRIAFHEQPRQAEKSTEDLLTSLSERPALKVLSGNPLLLTITAVIARHQRLARSRVGLYK